jgi:hypothetical protein
MEYRKIGYSLADCMRCDPKYGKKGFTVGSEQLGTENIDEVYAAASLTESTPEGYELKWVRNVQTGERRPVSPAAKGDL